MMDWLAQWAPVIVVLSLFGHAFLLNIYRSLLHRDNEQQRRYLREMSDYVNRMEAIRENPGPLLRQMEIADLERMKRL